MLLATAFSSITEFTGGNNITLLHNGVEYFPALIAECDKATQEIHLEAYIFDHDETGILVTEALKRAAQRGVQVRVVIDGFGSRSLPPKFLRDLKAAGVQVLIFRPEASSFNFKRHRLRRMHRKISLIDNRIAFVGGINILDDYHAPRFNKPRFDYAVRIEGPLVENIRIAVKRLWGMLAWINFKRRWIAGPPPASPPPICGTIPAAFLIRDNLNHRRDIEAAYLQAIVTAQFEIIIANAYFLPGIDFRHALIAAAKRGVKVVLMLQGRREYLLVHFATRALYADFLQAGIYIYEYHQGFMHAKVAVVDGIWATVGSSNIDPFSLILSREANVVVRDADFSQQLRGSLELAMQRECRRIEHAGWKKTFWLSRFMSWVSFGMVRFLMGMVGYTPEKNR